MVKKSERTKKLILESAVEVLTVNPAASLQDIAEAAGVGRVTLHRHFGSRDFLIQELARYSLEETDRACEPIESQATSAKHALELLIDVLVRLGDRFHFIWYGHPNIWNCEELADEIKRHDDELRELISEVKREGAIAADVPTAWVISCIENLSYAAWSSTREGSIAPNDAAKLVCRTLFQGLATTSPD